MMSAVNMVPFSRRTRKFLTLVTAAATAVVLTNTAGHADVVTLSHNDSAISVSGALLDYNGTQYTIRTAVGILELSAEGVICAGEGCPEDSAAAVPNYRIEIVSRRETSILPAFKAPSDDPNLFY